MQPRGVNRDLSLKTKRARVVPEPFCKVLGLVCTLTGKFDRRFNIQRMMERKLLGILCAPDIIILFENQSGVNSKNGECHVTD